jgi:NAD(P)-dependent dehydrogenase (short-subunit alcohol dehydrogenase family)
MILDKFKLDGKVALVTGASVGLGQAMAVALAEAGADVAVHCHRDGEASETCASIEQLNRKAVSVAGDMADKSAPKRIAD